MSPKNRKPPPVETDAGSAADAKITENALFRAAVAHAAKSISNPVIYNNPRSRDAIIFHIWNRLATFLCRNLRQTDMRRWGRSSRPVKERQIESFFPRSSFRKFEQAVLETLGELIHLQSRKRKRATA